jgi:hypothetical protein
MLPPRLDQRRGGLPSVLASRLGARIFAPITLPPHMTSRVLVLLIANDYIVIQRLSNPRYLAA